MREREKRAKAQAAEDAAKREELKHAREEAVRRERVRAKQKSADPVRKDSIVSLRRKSSLGGPEDVEKLRQQIQQAAAKQERRRSKLIALGRTEENTNTANQPVEKAAWAAVRGRLIQRSGGFDVQAAKQAFLDKQKIIERRRSKTQLITSGSGSTESIQTVEQLQAKFAQLAGSAGVLSRGQAQELVSQSKFRLGADIGKVKVLSWPTLFANLVSAPAAAAPAHLHWFRLASCL
jgi:hypothetical protein